MTTEAPYAPAVLEDVTPETFRPHLGTEFQLVLADGGRMPVTLGEVTDYPVHPQSPRSEPFGLRFDGPADAVVGQGTHVLEHEAVGRLELFLVPIGPGRYEAVFN